MFLFQAMHSIQSQKALDAEKNGKIVLADRWDESYIAYHSQYGPLAENDILRNEMNLAAFQGRKPDLVIYPRLETHQAMQRILAKAVKMDYFDLADASYHESMMRSYDQQASQNNWLVVDATLCEDILGRLIFDAITRLHK